MADNDIIDFYKKADTDSKPEEPLKEQVETPEPVVSEAVVVPVPESNDPFDKFLFNLAEKLKTEKKITEQQQLKFNERVVKPTTNPEDPFAKFLESFAGLVKEDENINKEDNIKEATIDFINKLKNDDFFDRDIPKIIPKVKSKSKKYLPPKFAKKIETVEEELPVIEQSTEPEAETKQPEPSNPYLKELQSTDKKKNKIEDKISGLSDIKKIIAQQVQEQLSKYPNIGFTGGGGGTNAVQYAEGGTMNGNLTVNGAVNATTYLSGGVNLANLLSSSGGGGEADRLVSGSASLVLNPDGTIDFPNDTIRPPDQTILTLESEYPALSSYTRIALSPYAFFAYDNEGNSITFDEVDNAIVLTSRDLYEWTFNSEGKLIGPSGTLAVSGNVDVTSKFLSGGVDLADIFITSAEESQTLAYNTQTELLSINRGNSVSLSSLSDKSYANSNFLKLSGGIISGNLTIQGNVSALGTATFANTIFATTSALSVVNTGPGPALYVFQASGPYDVASFYDGDGIEVLHVGNAGPGGFGKVGVNESFPNEELTVRGSISATEVVYAPSILVDLLEPDPLSPNNKLQASSLTVLGTDPVAAQPTTTILKGGAFFGSADGTRGIMVERQTALGDAIYFTGLNDQITEYNNILFTTGYYPQFWLEKDTGNVGIGTNTPTATLDVNGTINTTSYLSAGVNLLDIFSGGGGGATPIKRFDYVTVSNIDYSYSGSAAFGTLDTSPTWKLIRLTYANNGSISNSASAIDSWTGRLTATYV